MSAQPSFAIANVFTGELLDPDDLPALKNALEEIEDYLAEKRRPLRRIYQARDQIQARVAQLEPITLPKRRWQTDKQQRVARCPHCAHVIEDSESEPQTGADGLGTARTVPSGSGKAADPAGPAVGTEAPVTAEQERSLPAGDAGGASPAPLLEEA